MSVLTKAIKIVAINVAVLVLLFVLVEGAASLTIIGYRVVTNPGLAEQFHSRYDETLGWVARPNVNLPDQYGPGAYLRTNSQAFRNDHDIAVTVPEGKTRLVCSGDSFTLGFGVSNDHAWCQRLATIDPRLETVNMGQGGYGVDQAYLWYMRDGAPLEHQLLLFGFITDDFSRMQIERFQGYAKPVLDVRNDSIMIRNYPVPRTSWFTRWRAANNHNLSNFQFIQLWYLGAGRLGIDRAEPPSDSAAEDRARRVAAKIFESLARSTREKNRQLVLVYLAGPGDYRANGLTTEWQRFVHVEAKRLGIPVIDLVEVFRRVPPTEINDLFAPNSHYSVKGNELVANVLYKELIPMLNLPRVGN